MKCKIVVVVYRSMFSSIVSNRPCREHWLVLESAVKLSQWTQYKWTYVYLYY